METIWIYALVSVAAVSAMSLLGLSTIRLSNANLERITAPLISVAVGVMLGNACIHMIPEAFERIHSGTTVGLLIVAGIFLFFFVERVLHCRHECSKPHDEHPIGMMSLTADMLENFIDGTVIGVSYLISIETGIAVTIGVLVHEIPNEMSKFFVLVKSLGRTRALLCNMASTVTAFIGVILALSIGSQTTTFAAYVLPVAAGCFIYLSAGGLIPRYLQSSTLRGSFLHIALMTIGVAAMLALKLME